MTTLTQPYPSAQKLSVAVLRHLTRLACHQQLEVRLGALDMLAQAGSAAAPCFVALAREAPTPQTQLEAAHWLRLHNYALPLVVKTCAALALAPHEHTALEAIAELDAVRDDRGIPETLARIAIQGATPRVRATALEAIRRRSEQQPTAAQRPAADPFRAAAWPTEAARFPAAILTAAPRPTPPASHPQSAASAPALPTRPVTASHPIIGDALDLTATYPWRLPLLLVAMITLAEIMITFADPLLGLLLHIGTLFALLSLMLQPGGPLLRRFRTVLPLVPLVRILSLGLPLASWPQISWYFAVSVPLFAAMLIVVQLEPWTRAELGLTLGRLPEQLIIGLAGLGLGWIEYQILRPTPLTPELTWQALWLPALVLIVSTGYLEELLFRGLLQSASMPILGHWPSILFVTALFAVLHIGYASVFDVLFVFAVGFAFSLIVARTRSLIGVTLAHSLTNISLFLLWPHWLN